MLRAESWATIVVQKKKKENERAKLKQEWQQLCSLQKWKIEKEGERERSEAITREYRYEVCPPLL
jgi:Ribonuclease G/E